MEINTINCLGRTDPNKDIFRYTRKDSTMKNWHSLLKVEDLKIICENKNYSLTELCRWGNGKQPCNVSSSFDMIDLYPK